MYIQVYCPSLIEGMKTQINMLTDCLIGKSHPFRQKDSCHKEWLKHRRLIPFPSKLDHTAIGTIGWGGFEAIYGLNRIF